MDLSAEVGGEAGAHRLESNTQQKGKKCSEKCLNIFVMQICSDEDEHFSEHFFQSWNQIPNTQKIAGWYKVGILFFARGQICPFFFVSDFFGRMPQANRANLLSPTQAD